MTIEDFETSEDEGQPVELLLWTMGAYELRETTSDETVDLGGGDVYPPSAIRREGIEIASDPQDQATLNITAPLDHPIMVLFRGLSPPDNLSLRIRLLHRTDVDEEIEGVWAGTVDSAAPVGDVGVIVCSPIPGSLAVESPRYTDQRTCQHQLYGQSTNGCLADPADFTIAGTLATVSGITLTSTAFSSEADNWLTGGEIVVVTSGRTERRRIESHTGSTITIQVPFEFAGAGASYTATAGCDRLRATCDTKFGNILNFDGAPMIPTKNPFQGGFAV